MTTYSPLQHLKGLSGTLGARLSGVEEFIDDITSGCCCTDSKRACENLLGVIEDEVHKNIDTFMSRIELAEFQGKTEFSFEDIESAIYADQKLKNILRMLSSVHHHSLLKDAHSCLVHSLQVLMHQNGQFLNNIQSQRAPAVREILPLCSLSGPQPGCQSTGLDVIAVTLPYPDAVRVEVWPLLSHEFAHGFYRHKSSPDRPEKNYENEFRADFYATLYMGPAYLMSFFNEVGRIPGRAKVRGFGVVGGGQSHPYIELRLPLILDVLGKLLDFPHERILEFKSCIEPLYHYTDPELEKDSNYQVQMGVYHSVLKGYLADRELTRLLTYNAMTFARYKKLPTLDDVGPKDMQSGFDGRDVLNCLFKGKGTDVQTRTSEKDSKLVRDLIFGEGIRLKMFKGQKCV